MKMFAILSLALAPLLAPMVADAAEDVVVVYDASGSMWGQIDGVAKVEIAREVMGDLIATWPERANIGLMAYGHRREGDCSDIETLIAPSPLDRSTFVTTVNRIMPRGRTPLTESVRQAAELLSYRDTQATVILISDGLETCQADPCALSAELAQQGVDFTAHVVGFDLTEEEHIGLACIAENTGGVFVPAQNADELRDALAHVQSVVDLQPLSPPEPVTEPEVEPATVAIGITAPEQVTTGATFSVSWSETVDSRDYVSIVPMGADEGEFGNYLVVREASEGELTAPAEPGLYEVRYILNENRVTLGSATIEVTEAAISVTAPDQVTTGATFPVSWSETVNTSDYVSIVPMGADEGEFGNYLVVRDAARGDLTAPAEPGLYEVRYILNEGRSTLGSAAVEVVEPEIVVTGPGTVRAEAPITVSWSATVNISDYVSIVPMGADEGEFGDYLVVRDATEGRLTAPSQPGVYEVRYILNEGRRTLAREDFEVVAADAPLDEGAGLSVPGAVSSGQLFTVTWQAKAKDARVALARADQADFSWIEAQSANTEGAVQFIAPDDAGVYEIRFLDIANQAVLGRTIVVVE